MTLTETEKSRAVKGFKFDVNGQFAKPGLLPSMVETKEVIERKGRRNSEAHLFELTDIYLSF